VTGYTHITKAHYYLSGGLSNPRLLRITKPGTGVFIYWQRNN
jgi:hypothetical protein